MIQGYFRLPKFSLHNTAQTVNFAPWAVLGEGCSSARDSQCESGRFNLEQSMPFEAIEPCCDFSVPFII